VNILETNRLASTGITTCCSKCKEINFNLFMRGKQGLEVQCINCKTIVIITDEVIL